MHGSIREDHYAMEEDDVSFVREWDGELTVVPKSLRNAGPDKRAAITAMMRAAAAYEQAYAALSDAVADARDLGVSWDGVGWAVGSTGSGARKRFTED